MNDSLLLPLVKRQESARVGGEGFLQAFSTSHLSTLGLRLTALFRNTENLLEARPASGSSYVQDTVPAYPRGEITTDIKTGNSMVSCDKHWKGNCRVPCREQW